MQGVGSAGNRCLPNDLHDLAKDFQTAYNVQAENKEKHLELTTSQTDSYEEVIQVLGLLQDCCPGLFAHKSLEDAMTTIVVLDLHNGSGLPKRY